MNANNLRLGKSTLAWLLLSVFAVIVPHARHLPLWVLICVVSVIVWRVQIFRGQWRVPRRWSKLFLVLGCIAALQWHYQTLLGLEPMVALLITSLVLKLLEMYRRKDATAVVLLCFFTTAAQFLFGQTAFDFIYACVCSLLLVATLVSLNRNGSASDQRAFSLGLKLTLQSLPIMLILFLFFPRIGSLWTVPLPQNSAKTGISSEIAPGDISSLAREGGKAFTVSFDGAIPANEDLYWRGLVMSDFDGRRWSVNRWSSYPTAGIVKWKDHSIQSKALDWYDQSEKLSQPVVYQIILEPTQQPWLFALPLAEVALNSSGVTRDFTVVNHAPIAKRTVVNSRSYLDYRIEAQGLPKWFKNRNLALPEGYNPQTLAMAQQWRSRGDQPQQIIDNFLALISNQFSYTLQPKLLGKHSVDDFLWNTKEGYCEHYASAFVVFMRAAGIPARVVAGYQGGEVIEDFLQVSQTDAHAWAEVWLEDIGWKRIDPTAAIAPE